MMSGGSTQGHAGLLLPPGQSQVAGALGDIVTPLVNMSANGGAGTPGAWAYPQAQSYQPNAANLVQQYLTGSFGGGPTQFDQFSQGAIGGAQQAGNLYGGLAPQIAQYIPGLAAGAGGGTPYISSLLQNAFSPLYGDAVQYTVNNPYFGQEMAGAQQGARLGSAGAEQMYGAGSGILQAGFDPQNALFRRTQQQLTDQSAAANAMSGLGSSPYGAGLTSKALGDFDINWQNNLLNRETTAANAASPLLSGAPSLAAGSAALPSNAYLGQLQADLGALGAQGKAGALGASAFPSLVSGVGTGLGQANNLASGIAGNTASFGALPYNMGATIAGNATNGIGNLQSLLQGATSLGNNQFLLPQQVIGDLLKYMGLGQSGSEIAAGINAQNFNQGMQSAGGLGSLAGLGSNMLFGNQGISGALGLGGGGLFGGGTDLALSGPGILDAGYGLAGADAGGGLGAAAGLLPLAAS